jgi:Tol biopolymer transport system component
MRAALAIAAVALVVVLPAGGSTPSARILFDEPHGSSFDLVEIDADATNYLDLTPGDQTFYAGDQDGSWSPDGSRILFTSHRDSNVSTEIYVMSADGSNQRRLTNDGPNGVQNSSPEIFDSDPVWSPDGNEIAYVKKVGQAKNVWLMRPDGTAQRRSPPTAANRPLSAGSRREPGSSTSRAEACSPSSRAIRLYGSPPAGSRPGRRTARRSPSSGPGSTRSWRASSGLRRGRTSTRSDRTAPTCVA